VKAVNSMLQGVLAEDNPVDVFFAGDSAEAKTRVVAFLESSDMRPPTQEGSKWLMSLNGPAYFYWAWHTAAPASTSPWEPKRSEYPSRRGASAICASGTTAPNAPRSARA